MLDHELASAYKWLARNDERQSQLRSLTTKCNNFRGIGFNESSGPTLGILLECS